MFRRFVFNWEIFIGSLNFCSNLMLIFLKNQFNFWFGLFLLTVQIFLANFSLRSGFWQWILFRFFLIFFLLLRDFNFFYDIDFMFGFKFAWCFLFTLSLRFYALSCFRLHNFLFGWFRWWRFSWSWLSFRLWFVWLSLPLRFFTLFGLGRCTFHPLEIFIFAWFGSLFSLS